MEKKQKQEKIKFIKGFFDEIIKKLESDEIIDVQINLENELIDLGIDPIGYIRSGFSGRHELTIHYFNAEEHHDLFKESGAK